MRLEWKVFISSKPCRLIVVPRQEFIKHMFGKLLFFFVFPKLGISYKAKKAARIYCRTTPCVTRRLNRSDHIPCITAFLLPHLQSGPAHSVSRPASDN